MAKKWTPRPLWDARRDPRALVCARAIVKAEDTSATEHLTYDLSVGGLRLCGVPRAEVGDPMRLLLHLPTTSVAARGRLVRVSRSETHPEFALQFEDMEANAEDAIQDAVLEALAQQRRHSLMLLRSFRDPHWRGWNWLAPLSSICVDAGTPLEVLRRIEEDDISVAVAGEATSRSQLSHWQAAVPQLAWRTMDREGRLWSPAPAARASARRREPMAKRRE